MEEISLKQKFLNLFSTNKPGGSSFDMVKPVEYLYIRVVKAKNLFVVGDIAYDPYVEVRFGNTRASTTAVEKKPNPKWNQVFAFVFSKDQRYVEILLRNNHPPQGDNEGGVKGRLFLPVNDALKRVPSDRPIVPQWHKLEEAWRGVWVRGELLLAVWIGTQADEAFAEALHSDAAGVSGQGVVNSKPKVYLSPKLWYLRVNVIQVYDLVLPNDRGNRAEVFVRAVFGNRMSTTKVLLCMNANHFVWNETLLFVAAEPFEDQLVLSVEDRVGNNRVEVLGRCVIHLGNLERRLVDKRVDSRWFALESQEGTSSGRRLEGKIQLRVSLDGGYQVLDEATNYSISDIRPTTVQQVVGVLELGILNASGLPAMKKKEGRQRRQTDAYCVAKYGQKWVRTRTITDSCSPQWNEQYTWEVHDPCTVITVGVFDNCHLQDHPDGGGRAARDSEMGKIRIRLSALETNRIYTESYPLLVLKPQGLIRMGYLQLAIRFSCSSIVDLLEIYTRPILPIMHYTRPLNLFQQDRLSQQAAELVSMRLGRAEPPLRREVVEYMLDCGSSKWSKRRTLAHSHRIRDVFSSVEAMGRWVGVICSWKKPLITMEVHILLSFLIFFPEFILPLAFFCFFLLGLCKYRSRPRGPPHMDPQLSCAENVVTREDWEEEFDGLPTSCDNIETLRVRYDQLRVVSGQTQYLLGYFATQVERLQSLLSWRDPRATWLFVTVCYAAGVLVLSTDIRVILVTLVFYTLRHPSLRTLPPTPLNFFHRLPARSDSML